MKRLSHSGSSVKWLVMDVNEEDHNEETTVMTQVEGPNRKIQMGRKAVGSEAVIWQSPSS